MIASQQDCANLKNQAHDEKKFFCRIREPLRGRVALKEE
jgi:hypothetical protein